MAPQRERSFANKQKKTDFVRDGRHRRQLVLTIAVRTASTAYTIWERGGTRGPSFQQRETHDSDQNTQPVEHRFSRTADEVLQDGHQSPGNNCLGCGLSG